MMSIDFNNFFISLAAVVNPTLVRQTKKLGITNYCTDAKFEGLSLVGEPSVWRRISSKVYMLRRVSTNY